MDSNASSKIITKCASVILSLLINSDITIRWHVPRVTYTGFLWSELLLHPVTRAVVIPLRSWQSFGVGTEAPGACRKH